MKLTRLARILAAAAVPFLGGCILPPRSAASDPSGSVVVVFPLPGVPLSETYPGPAAPREPVRRAVFERINRDRARLSLLPVAWDEGASRVADAFCARQVAERTRGHFLRDGIPPYARTGFAGLFGMQAENSVSWITTGPSFEKEPEELALAGHEDMMSERPPDDGHRRTILDPEATHVGVGWALASGRFQMAQEFLTRRLERLAIANEGGRVVRVRGAARSGERIRFVTVAREPPPRPLTGAEATARTSYRYPAADLALIPEGYRQMRVLGLANADRLRLGHDRDFEFSFAPEGAGLWTFVFYVSPREADTPRPGGSAVVRAAERGGEES